MMSAKAPTAAKIAPMMMLLEFISLVLDAAGVWDVRKVNWSTETRQHGCVNDRKDSSSQYRHQSQALY